MLFKISSSLHADFLEFVSSLETVDKDVENSIGFQLAPMLISHAMVDVAPVADCAWWWSSCPIKTEPRLDDVLPLGLQIGFYNSNEEGPVATTVVFWSQIKGLSFLEPIKLTVDDDRPIDEEMTSEKINPVKKPKLYPGQWKDE